MVRSQTWGKNTGRKISALPTKRALLMEIEKDGIRAYIKEKRKELSKKEKEEKSRKAAANAVGVLKTLRERQEFSWVYCYMDLEKEAGTRDIISWCMSRGLHVAAPKVFGNNMEFFEITSLGSLKPGTMGILEPEDGAKRALEASSGGSIFCPVIVPGTAFGKNGGRVGYGGGYYDRFFAREPRHKMAGYCFSFQVLERIPLEDHDIKMDMVITEGGIAYWDPQLNGYG